MQAANEAEIVKLDEQKKTAEEQEGDTEIRDALQAKADFYNRIGDKEKALEAETKNLTYAAIALHRETDRLKATSQTERKEAAVGSGTLKATSQTEWKEAAECSGTFTTPSGVG